MKFRLASLLGTVVLVLAVPVSADSVFYTGATSGSPDTADSAKMIHRSDANRMTLPRVGFAPSLESAVALGWADATSDAGIAEDSTDNTTFVRDTRHFALVPDEPLSDAPQAEPTSAMFSMAGFQWAGGFNGKSSGRSVILSEFESNGRDSTIFTDGKNLHGKGRDHDGGDNGKKQNQDAPGSIPVPEPAAFSLVLLGLAALGIMVRRSREFPPAA